MLFEKVEKRRIITFYVKTSTVDVGERMQPQQHWPKQHSKVVTPQEGCFPSFNFCQGVSSFISFANEITNFKVFYYLPLTCFTTFFLF